MAGYILIHRKIREWGWYGVPCVKDVFLHLVLTANFADGYYKGVEVKRGQAVFGYESLSAELGFTIQQIRTAIKKLKKTGEIDVCSNHQFSIATINNYANYQFEEQQTNNKRITNVQQTNNKRLTDVQQTDNSIIIINNNKKEERIYTYVQNSFNSICKSLPKVSKITETRKRRIDKASKLLGAMTFEALFRKVEASDFLTGKQKEWIASFDWIMKPENLTKIIEGNYDNKSKPTKGSIYSADDASFDISHYENSVFD